ncbi:MAG: hypothetical protein CVU66_00665 [Deltaproteobacteria bacterium HGW-Deltaproteobacteria-23]|nr:MAG: hypothetical protein CVU66_00665 [Deltaproteobacteria bacterium HGW-Deltaproteobacteria-23]
MKYRYIIGIDPDLTKSGFAVYDSQEKKMVQCEALSFSELQWKLKRFQPDCFVRLEAGWLIKKSNWRTAKKLGKKFSPSQASSIAERQAKNVGENHATGKLIEQYLKENNIPYELVRPFGATAFFRNTAMFQKTTGWSKRTNNDARSAAAICWGVNKNQL